MRVLRCTAIRESHADCRARRVRNSSLHNVPWPSWAVCARDACVCDCVRLYRTIARGRSMARCECGRSACAGGCGEITYTDHRNASENPLYRFDSGPRASTRLRPPAVTARQTAGSGLSHRAFLQHGLWCSHQHAGEVRNIIMLSLALSALSVPAVRLPALRATLRCQRPPAMQTAHQPPALHSRRA